MDNRGVGGLQTLQPSGSRAGAWLHARIRIIPDGGCQGLTLHGLGNTAVLSWLRRRWNTWEIKNQKYALFVVKATVRTQISVSFAAQNYLKSACIAG